MKVAAGAALAAVAAAGLVSNQPAEAALPAYDATVLADSPVAYWPLNATGQDLSGRGHTGKFVNGQPGATTLPNGDAAVAFDGQSQYLTVPTGSDLSIPSSGTLTWEGWIRPDTLQFPRSTGGYVDWMGKCQGYAPNCEWEARMYNQVNSQNRESRLSAYAFNTTAGLGSGADWQPATATVVAGRWLHVVGVYQVATTPAECSSAYPGTIEIWVNAVKWNTSYHRPTGCMSQYSITPTARTSPVNIGTMSFDSYFQGAIGKVAIYSTALTQQQITAHYTAMTGLNPAGACLNVCTIPPGAASDTAAAPSPTPSTSPTASATAVPPSVSPSSVSSPSTSISSPAPVTSVAPPASIVSSTPAPPPAGTTAATWTRTSVWNTGYCASVTITAARRVTSWSATIAVPGKVTKAWDATATQSGSTLTLRNRSYNGTIAAGSRTTAGFCAAM